MLNFIGILFLICAVHGAALKSNIPEFAKKLAGDELISYVNLNQKLWAAQKSKFTNEQKRSRANHKRFIKPHDDTVESPIMANIPEFFDAREHWPNCPTIGRIRDQSDCGSAAHFVAVEIASDRTCIVSNGTFNLPLSPEDALGCCVGEFSACGDGWGCDGSWPADILKFWISHGLVTGGDYYDQTGCQPYSIYPCGANKYQPDGSTAPPVCPGYHTPKCLHECVSNNTTSWPIPYKDDKHFGKNHYKIAKKMEAIQTEIMTNGPVIASFILYDDFYDYKSGVYVHTAGDEYGGMVLKIIGWGVENSVPYWLCAMQWGDDYGDKGYVKFLRAVNECGIEHQVIAGMPNLDKHN
ncbi:unnamed protein product [Caenorhabditis bovis]|uniref:Peptidase C1A papain C-terminal domain-containing protein n=1 Tax=Caenorhabditis bovis TaxID=2654633 RepID=A0A8S1E5S8_9PELO|nr:unnamed protein product [Caenorhabditis bovis]